MAILQPQDNLPTEDFTDQQWINWHKSLRLVGLSKDEAAALFLKAWKQRGSSSANNDELRTYLKGQGIDISADFSDFTWLTNPFGFSDWIKNTVHVYFIVACVVVFLVFLIAYRLSKNTKLDIPIV